jgi:hypothetical protein
MYEILVQAARKQVQGTREAQPLCGAHGADVALKPRAPRGLRPPQAVAPGRADALRYALRSGGPELLRQHWPGPDQSLQAVMRLAFGR